MEEVRSKYWGNAKCIYKVQSEKTEFRRPFWIAKWMVFESTGLHKRLAIS